MAVILDSNVTHSVGTGCIFRVFASLCLVFMSWK